MKILFVVLAIALFLFLWKSARRKKPVMAQIPEQKEDDLLKDHVRFYAGLNERDKESFCDRIAQFLEVVTITPIGEVVLTDLDRLYVAAAAIIPIFHHRGWMYHNLNEVLIYPGSFTKDFIGNTNDSNVLGMVGSGAMNRMMILSIGALRAGFERQDGNNTGIHEFAHLLDKADGEADGLPQALLSKALQGEWLENMRRGMNRIHLGYSDINPYGGSNEAEFFAVVSEYFFEKPNLLKEEHPKIWKLMESMYMGGETESSKA